MLVFGSTPVSIPPRKDNEAPIVSLNALCLNRVHLQATTARMPSSNYLAPDIRSPLDPRKCIHYRDKARDSTNTHVRKPLISHVLPTSYPRGDAKDPLVFPRHHLRL